ncbi:ABC transporter substrate-binding protein [Caldalkalibacillus salinus]|uniref:ABC transporter substrate-binding protein n=1 Tax=Caldalkalibacillus salinus TaxID=2803787 RepID=UPI0030167184
MREKRILRTAFILFLSLALGACGAQGGTETTGQAEQGQDQGQDLEPVKVGYVNVMDDAQAMLAKDAGLYEAHGLDVELQLFASGTDLIKGIVNGELDAGVLGFTNGVSWSSRGADLKVVGGAQMGYHSILAHEDSGIETVEDLKGKDLATQKQGSTADVVLNGVTFEEAGLKRQDVNMNYVSPSVAVQSLQAGKADAAFLFEPYDRIARLQGNVDEIYEIGKVWPFPCMVVITSGDKLDEDREKINKILDAQKDAIEMLENEPREAAEYIYHRFVEGDTFDTPDGEVSAVDVIQEAIEAQTFTWQITPENVQQMQDLADIMVDQGVIDEPFDVESIIDLNWQESQE